MTPATTRIDSLTDFQKEPGGEYQRWVAEVEASNKELDKWRKKSRSIVKEFRADRSENNYVDPTMERRFNLFAANTQILQTALLNQQPKPTVNREFNDALDDVGRVAAWIMERALERQAKREDYKLFNILMQIVQDNLVPGVGLSWHTYKAEIEEREEEPSELELQIDPQAKPTKYEEIIGEEIIDEYVYWEDIIWSPCRSWGEVRWLGRKTYLTRDQLVKRFGKEIGEKVPLNYTPKKNENSVETKNELFQQAVVYEIWDKETKKVLWFCIGHDKILETKDDFLGLKNFFPCPKPLFATVSNGQLIPIPDYRYAADQYRELNEINTRLGLLVKACRVAGVYDKASPQVQSLLSNAAENVLVPVDHWAMFAEKGGMKGSIDWLPLEQIVAAIDQLMKAREDIKAQIYEVTGMSDIIRGASKASETLGAQKIKAQYASMRIQKRQKEVATYVSGVFDIQSQLMRHHMDPQEIATLAQVESMGEDQQVIIAALQLIKDPQFEFHCQVESDTLSDIDFQAEKADRMEYMQTITLFLKESGQMLVNDPLVGPLVAQLLQFSLAGFKVGKKFEGQLDKTIQAIQQKLKNPPPPQKTPEQQKVEADIQLEEKRFQLDSQAQKETLQFKREDQQIKSAGAQAAMRTKINAALLDQRLQEQKAHSDARLQQQRAAQQQQKAQLEMFQMATQPRGPTQ